MANYCCATRTNYFRVKNPDEFRSFMRKVLCSEDKIDVWEKRGADGVTRFGFGCYGEILGLGIGPQTEESYDYYDDFSLEDFVNGLSELVAKDDAIIIMESGNEKLRYVTGYAIVITSGGSDSIDIGDVAGARAREFLANENWATDVSY